MSSNANIYRVTGRLWGESIGDRWIPLPNDSPHKGQWLGALMLSLTCARKTLSKNQDVGDLGRHRPQYDVTVMHLILQLPLTTVVIPICIIIALIVPIFFTSYPQSILKFNKRNFLHVYIDGLVQHCNN